MTRSTAELLRDVATALTCYASTKHAQAHVQKIPSIKAAMLEEVAHIEALEREVRETLRAQAESGTWGLEYSFNPSEYDIHQDVLYQQYRDHVNGREGTGAIRRYEVHRRFGELLARADALGDPVVSEGLIWMAWHTVKDREMAQGTNEALRFRLIRQSEIEKVSVAVPRETVEGLLAGWDEGLWGPDTQDAGVPDTALALVDGLRAALAQRDAGGQS